MSTVLITHPSFLAHDTGEYHPERPDRLRAILKALQDKAFAGLVRAEAPMATMEQLTRVHPAQLVETLLNVNPPPGELVNVDADTVISAGTGEAIQRAAGALVLGVETVFEERAESVFAAVRPPGHHASATLPAGFCLFNNVVIGARHAQAKYGVERVAIVDFDVHHGNGTQAIAETDATLFYGSTHQYPFYPGTGSARERGLDGNVVNMPLGAGSGSEEFRTAWADRILPALDRFAPQLLIVSAGFDAHRRDPLAQLNLEAEDFAWLTRELVALSDKHCKGKLVSALEGGYDLQALAASAAAHVRELMRVG